MCLYQWLCTETVIKVIYSVERNVLLFHSKSIKIFHGNWSLLFDLELFGSTWPPAIGPPLLLVSVGSSQGLARQLVEQQRVSPAPKHLKEDGQHLLPETYIGPVVFYQL